jgi:hypothetical protein
MFLVFMLLKIKRMKLVAGFAALLVSLVLTSFTRSNTVDEVVSALATGNASEVARHFDARVDLTLPDKAGSYSKAQAEMILKDFFAGNAVKGFKVKHKGENKDGSQFCIGTLQTKVREYRTRFFLQQKGNVQVLQELVISVDN